MKCLEATNAALIARNYCAVLLEPCNIKAERCSVRKLKSIENHVPACSSVLNGQQPAELVEMF